MKLRNANTTVALMCLLLSSCQRNQQADSSLPRRLPRPVSVIQLEEFDPGRVDRVTGLAGSWKTEDLGFEVSGRVNFVIEPERDVDGDVFTVVGDGELAERSRRPAVLGTLLAKLNDSRYQYTVNSVKAQIETAKQQKRATEIEATSVIPAERDAAIADLAYTKSEVDRNRPMVESRAVSKAEFERTVARYAAAQAKVAQVDATKQAKEAEVASLQARIEELGGTLDQALRDVADCELRSPFRGQVAQVHVIAGGVVQPGQPVVTVQMMDPIKVELEVSAATSRRLNYRDLVDVIIPQPTIAGQHIVSPTTGLTSEHRQRAIVYTIDPVADPVTRTFTVTLLMRNEKVQSPPPADFAGPIARVRDVWRLRDAPYSPEGPDAGLLTEGEVIYFVDEKGIHRDAKGHYAWKIENWQNVEERNSQVLQVSKIRVNAGELRLDWLGLWTFRQVAIAEGEVFDIETDYLAGELACDERFDGDKLLWDWQRWRVRPGDLVGVELPGGQTRSGFFVPMDALSVRGDKTYVFVVRDGRAIQMEVTTLKGPNTLRRIEAVGSEPLTSRMHLVREGVHYLVDGEEVNVVDQQRVLP